MKKRKKYGNEWKVVMMADINKELDEIKNAVYGKEVRGSIHDGIKKINEESEESKLKANEAHDVMESIVQEGFDNAALESNFEQKLDDKIANLQPEWTQFKEATNAQLADTEYEILNSKDDINMLKKTKAEKGYVDDQISNLGDLSPKGVYDTVVDLQSAYPDGASGIFLVKSTNKWYFWDGGWVEGGLYQSAITNDFPATNLVTNGDFSDGTTGWLAASSELSVSNNILSNTGTGASATPSARTKIGNTRGGDLYYFKAKFKVNNNDANAAWIYYHSSGMSQVLVDYVANPVQNKEYVTSVIVEMEERTSADLYFRHEYNSASIADNKRLDIKYVMAINLTKVFGAGHEPTVKEMEKYLEKYPHEWFGGTVSPFVDQRELLLKTNSMVGLLDDTANKVDYLENLLKIEHKKPYPPKVSYELLDNWGSASRRFKYVDRNNVIWATNTQGRVEKSEDYGATWTTVLTIDTEEHGEIYNYSLAVTEEGRILIGTDTGKVLVSSQHQNDYWVGFQFDKGGRFSNQLAFKNYGEIVLIGGYNSSSSGGNESNEVYMSKDSGASWKRIFKGSVIDTAVNYHIHDVEYDFWDNRIFISVGDLRNRNLFYSDNDGDSWVKLFEDNEWEYKTNLQPTQILAYPHGIIFGSDSSEFGGLHYLPRKRGLNRAINKDDIIPDFFPIANGPSGAPAIFAVQSARVRKGNDEITLLPFRFMHSGNRSRLLASADGFYWHEIWRAEGEVVGLQNIYPIFIDGVLYCLGDYRGENNERSVFKAKLPEFI